MGKRPGGRSQYFLAVSLRGGQSVALASENGIEAAGGETFRKVSPPHPLFQRGGDKRCKRQELEAAGRGSRQEPKT